MLAGRGDIEVPQLMLELEQHRLRREDDIRLLVQGRARLRSGSTTLTHLLALVSGWKAW